MSDKVETDFELFAFNDGSGWGIEATVPLKSVYTEEGSDVVTIAWYDADGTHRQITRPRRGSEP